MNSKKGKKRSYVIVEHPEGFNPWDNNPVLIRMFAEAVVVSVTRLNAAEAIRRCELAADKLLSEE